MPILVRFREFLGTVLGLFGTKEENDARDPEVRDTVLEARSHIRTSRRLHREISAVQVKLERSSSSQQGVLWNSTHSSH